MGTQLVAYVKSSCKVLRDHSLITLSIFFLALLYRSFPFLFYLLIRSCPVLIGTALLLGCLLSYGDLELAVGSANATSQKEDKYGRADSSLKAYDLVSDAQNETTCSAQSWREYVPLPNQDDNPLLAQVHYDRDDGQEEHSDPESIIRETALPVATTENGDELHPLLQSDLIHTHIDEEEEESELSEDHEDEEEEANKDEEESNSAIKWTADDEKNLMDLGYLELERNQRLETLLLRRRARSAIKSIAERNLIDFEGTDSFNFPPIATKRQNPFDLPVDLMDDAPGSAPSVLHPRNNPFDRLSKQTAEVPASQTVYSRHASFHVGSSFWEFPRHFAPETCRVKENDSEMDDEHEVEEYPSNLVKHGSISSEDGELQETKKVDRGSTVSETSSQSVPDTDILEFDKFNEKSFQEIPAKENNFYDEQQNILAVDNFGVPVKYPRSPLYSGYQELSADMFEEIQTENDDNFSRKQKASVVIDFETPTKDNYRFPGTSRQSVSDNRKEEAEDGNELLFQEQPSGVTMDSERRNMHNRCTSGTSSRSASGSKKEEERYCFEEHKDNDRVSGASSSSTSSSDSEIQEVKDCLEIPIDYLSQNKSCVSGTWSSSGSDTENDEKHCYEEQNVGMSYETLNNDYIYLSGTSSPSVPDVGNEEEKHCVMEDQSRVAMVTNTDTQKAERSIERSYGESTAVDDESLRKDNCPITETLTFSTSEMPHQEVDELDKKINCESPSNHVPEVASSSVSDAENLKPMDYKSQREDNISLSQMSSPDTGKLETNVLNMKLLEESVAVDDGPHIKDPVYDSSPSSEDQVGTPTVNPEAPEVSLSVELGVRDDEKVKDVSHVGSMRLEGIEE